MLTDGPALRIVKSIEDENGYEAYRQLSRRFDPQSTSRNLARLNAILHFGFDCAKGAEVLDKILAWERMISDYEQNSGETVVQSLKTAVLVGKLPAAIRTHVLMHPSATKDYPSLRGLIEAYILTGRRWEIEGPARPQDKKNDGTAPMEIDAIKGKGKNKNKGKQPKGKGKGG